MLESEIVKRQERSDREHSEKDARMDDAIQSAMARAKEIKAMERGAGCSA